MKPHQIDLNASWLRGRSPALLPLVGLWLAALSPSSQAAEYVPIVRLGESYVHEDGRLEGGEIWRFTWGQPFQVLGHVEAFLGPLAHIDAAAPGVEYTWITDGMVSNGGVIAEDFISCGGTSVDAAGGRFKFVRDDTPDADPADPATFADGDALLEGWFSASDPPSGYDPPFSMFLGGCGDSDESWADVMMTLWLDGGSLFETLEPQDESMCAFAWGQFEMGEQLSPELLACGYFACFHAVLEADTPVPVRPVTWGRLKQLY